MGLAKEYNTVIRGIAPDAKKAGIKTCFFVLFTGIEVQWIGRVVLLGSRYFDSLWFSKRSRVWRIVNDYGRTGWNIVVQPVSIAYAQTDTAFGSLIAKHVVFICRKIFTSQFWLWNGVEQNITCDMRTVISVGRTI